MPLENWRPASKAKLPCPGDTSCTWTYLGDSLHFCVSSVGSRRTLYRSKAAAWAPVSMQVLSNHETHEHLLLSGSQHCLERTGSSPGWASPPHLLPLVLPEEEEGVVRRGCSDALLIMWGMRIRGALQNPLTATPLAVYLFKHENWAALLKCKEKPLPQVAIPYVSSYLQPPFWC